MKIKIPQEKFCLKCFNLHFKEGIYCSRNCANSRTHSIETNLKRSNTLKNKPKKEKLFKEKLLKEFTCTCCNNYFLSYTKRKSCTPDCRRKLMTEGSRKGGKSSAAIQNKRSKDEIKLFDLCVDHFINVTSNDTSIANGWDADILLHDYKIAILWNGPWHYREMGFKNHSLKQVQNRDSIKIKEFQKMGWIVEIYEDRYYSPESAFIELKNKIACTGLLATLPAIMSADIS